MTTPLRLWSRRDLIREVERLRAMLHEHMESAGNDARSHSVADHVDPGNSMFLRHIDTSLVNTGDADSGKADHAMLVLSGVVHPGTHVRHAYLLTPVDAALIVTELVDLANRALIEDDTLERDLFAVEFFDVLEAAEDEG